MPIETLLAFALVHLLAAASPGPNFFLVSGLAGRESRRIGLMAAFGIAVSVLIWSSVAALGLNVFLDRNPIISMVVQYAGASYLVWLGFKLLRSAMSNRGGTRSEVSPMSLAGLSAFRRGFFVNLGNPKTIAYYTSVFAVFVPGGSSAIGLLQIVMVAALVSCTWWCAVATFFSIEAVRAEFVRFARLIDLIAGVAFVLFGIRLGTRSQ